MNFHHFIHRLQQLVAYRTGGMSLHWVSCPFHHTVMSSMLVHLIPLTMVYQAYKRGCLPKTLRVFPCQWISTIRLPRHSWRINPEDDVWKATPPVFISKHHRLTDIHLLMDTDDKMFNNATDHGPLPSILASPPESTRPHLGNHSSFDFDSILNEERGSSLEDSLFDKTNYHSSMSSDSVCSDDDCKVVCFLPITFGLFLSWVSGVFIDQWKRMIQWLAWAVFHLFCWF